MAYSLSATVRGRSTIFLGGDVSADEGHKAAGVVVVLLWRIARVVDGLLYDNVLYAIDKSLIYDYWAYSMGPYSGPLCHALSLLSLSSLSWTSMRRRRATVAVCDSSGTW